MIDTTPTRWPAPAKLNLFLHVVGRRGDGYHRLQTVFQFIDLADVVTLAVRADGDVCRSNPLPGLADADDLCVRAARTLQRATGCTLGADIGLDKRIPIGAGLGGGSSDAATVLVALNEIWETGLNSTELAAIGLQLGADVPVFIHMQSAWAEGVGEILQAIDLPEHWYVVVDPGVLPSEIEDLARLSRQAEPEATTLIFTHGHWDHVLGRPWWPAARVVAHDGCAAEIARDAAEIRREAEALTGLVELTKARTQDGQRLNITLQIKI